LQSGIIADIDTLATTMAISAVPIATIATMPTLRVAAVLYTMPTSVPPRPSVLPLAHAAGRRIVLLGRGAVPFQEIQPLSKWTLLLGLLLFFGNPNHRAGKARALATALCPRDCGIL